MSNPAITTAIANDKEKQIKELENVLRLVCNNLNLLNDMEIKGAYAMPMAEVLNWLEAFKRSVSDQLNSLRPVLSDKPGDDKILEAEIVK